MPEKKASIVFERVPKKRKSPCPDDGSVYCEENVLGSNERSELAAEPTIPVEESSPPTKEEAQELFKV